MKLEKKHWYMIGAGIAIVGGIYLYRRNRKKQELANSQVPVAPSRINTQKPPAAKPAQNPIAKAVETPVKQPTVRSASFPLAKGMAGNEIKVVQAYANTTCKMSLDVNGNWDETTDQAIQNCKSISGNTVDLNAFKRMYRDLEAAKLLPA
jgi:hypothetical protein